MSTVDPIQQGNAGNRDDDADDQPFRLAGHEASSEEVEALQRPYQTDEHENGCSNVRSDLHYFDSASFSPVTSLVNARPRNLHGGGLAEVGKLMHFIFGQPID
jgi:hypothetical protein